MILQQSKIIKLYVMKKLEELFAELYHLLENWNYIPNPYQVRTRIENDIAALTV